MPTGMSVKAADAGIFTLHSAATVAADGAKIKVGGMSAVLVDITATGGTFTVTWKTILADGTERGRFGLNPSTGVIALTTSASGHYIVPVSGADDFFADITALAGSTVTVKARAFYGPLPAWAGASVVYNATPPTIADGATSQFQSDTNGNLKVVLANKLDPTNDGVTTYPFGHTYQAVVTADVQVSALPRTLHTVTFSCNDAAPTAGSFIIYDSLTEANTQVFNHTFTATPFAPFTLTFDIAMLTGIYFGFTTTADVNVSASYR